MVVAIVVFLRKLIIIMPLVYFRRWQMCCEQWRLQFSGHLSQGTW